MDFRLKGLCPGGCGEERSGVSILVLMDFRLKGDRRHIYARPVRAFQSLF